MILNLFLKTRQFTRQVKFNYRYKPSRFHEVHGSSQQFLNKRSRELRYNFGIYGMVFGLCWATIPLYRLFCQHFGLEGDLEQKDYSMEGKKMDIHRKFTLIFRGESDPSADWEFQPIQKSIVVHAGETALMFYRVYNKEDHPLIGFSTYQIIPEDASYYFSKIQCFCFNKQLINPKEELQLPIYFYLEPEILDDVTLNNCHQIEVNYAFVKSKNQDLAKMAAEELKKVKQNKLILQKMRETKEKEGLLEQEKIVELKNKQFSDQDLENFDEWAYDNQNLLNQEDLEVETESKQ